MAAVQPASINGDVKFTMGTPESDDDAFEPTTLEDEVIFVLYALIADHHESMRPCKIVFFRCVYLCTTIILS